MGLDVYAGTLTRYYSGSWETIVQQAGREAGEPVHVVRLQPDQTRIAGDRVEVRRKVLAWRDMLAEELRAKNRLPQPFDWPEEANRPYFTDKPDWSCFGALLLLAAYTELSRKLPLILTQRWEDDTALDEADRLQGNAYGHLYFTEMWFPVGDMAVFKAQTPTGKEIRIGSGPWLRHHLEDLNARTYKGSPVDMKRWSRDVPPGNEPEFEKAAKTGLSIMWRLAKGAEQNRLPILLDY